MPRFSLQRLRIGAWLALGDGALLAGGAALCLLPLLAYALLPGAAGVLGGALALPAAVFGAIMLRVPFSARPDSAEDGLRLQPSDAPALFDELNRIRTALGAPPLDAVYLDGELNAAIRQHRKLGGKTRNVLWLGQPLLEMLSPAACSAILAHECAHIAQRHGRDASRVYFARLQWQEVSDRLDRHRSLSSAPLRLFVAWYVPRFLAASLDFARQCEYQADAEAARVCGLPAATEALTAMALQWRALRICWPAFFPADDHDTPHPYSALAAHGALAVPEDEAEARVWLHDALCAPTLPGATHPLLADRLAALGATPDLPSTPLPWQRAHPSAAQAWLPAQRQALAAALDDHLVGQSAVQAQQLREEQGALVAELHDLQRKRRIRALSADEIARYAALRAGASVQAERHRRQADTSQRPAQSDGDSNGYAPHDLSPAELARLTDTLDPLLRIATGAWLLRQPDTDRYHLLVLARESAVLRVVGRLTGEPSYLRRDCEQLVARLLPRVRLDVEAAILAAGDPRLAACTDAARLPKRG